VPQRPAADVGLGDLAHVQRRLDAHVRAGLLQGVLELHRVDEDGEHPHVVAGRAVHAGGDAGDAAVDVPAARHDGDLDPARVHARDLLGDRVHAVGVGAVLERAHQGLARDLQEDPLEGGHY
jgi:hypothetical protein